MEQLLEKVRLLHIQNDFKNNKISKSACSSLKLGFCFVRASQISPNSSISNAILKYLSSPPLLGNCVAYDIDIIKLTSEKLDRLLKMKARTDGNGHSRLITELEEKE